MASTRSCPVKSANFHEAEVEQLAKTWISISTNPIVGCGQTSGQFWLSTTAHFNKSMEAFRRSHPGVVTSTFRTLRSVQSKWTDINHDCSKFSGNFSTIDALNETGVTYEHKIEKSLNLYKQLHKKGEDFKFGSCWDLLKECPKWQPARTVQAKQTNKRRRMTPPSALEGNENCQYDSSSAGGDKSDEALRIERPMGNKKAKDLASCEKRGQRHREGLADATNNIAAAMRERVSEMTERNETQLFVIDITRLDEHARDFLHRKRMLADLRLQEQTQEFHLSRMPTSAHNERTWIRSEDKDNSPPGDINPSEVPVDDDTDELCGGSNANEIDSESPEENFDNGDPLPVDSDGLFHATDIYRQWM